MASDRWLVVRRPGPYTAAAAYVALSLVMTWPLALGLGRDVPGDLGDSLLNMWILGWGAEHVPRLLTGALGWREFWNANIFFPAPLALALSEHLFGQTLAILPVYALTGNLILCYNLLFLSTFALSGWGTYLLVRDLTGDARAAFVAGLVFGFLPYRVASIPHMQVMSAQWMPLALFGLNRFATARSTWGLVGGAAALVMQNWSCGYYLLYFAPFAPLFVMQRLWAAGRLGEARAWLRLVAAAAVVAALTLPFLAPYLEAQRTFGQDRPFAEVVTFSANVWSYITAPEALRLWGRALRLYPHAEGETFLGFTAWALAAVGLWDAVRVARTEAAAVQPQLAGWKRIAVWLVGALVVSQLVAVFIAVVLGGGEVRLLGASFRARTPVRLLQQLAVAAVVLAVVSPRVRVTALRLVRTPMVFFFCATGLAMWLSLGPTPSSGEHLIPGMGLYGVLYDYVPGFKGVRVPARYAMIAGAFLAVMAGYGIAAINRRTRHGLAIASLAGVLVMLDGAPMPIEMNQAWAEHEATPPSRVYPPSGAPPVYHRIAALPASAVITEFPFGDFAWEIRYVYYSTLHFRPLTNGYSGAFPPTFRALAARLGDVRRDPEASWGALVCSGTTHAVLHPHAFADPARAVAVRNWLEAHGAAVVDVLADGDALYALPAVAPAPAS